ncbi:MAG: Npt1/Npt2 family nucleotide transporter [Terriglobia bacterium]
MDRLRAFFNLHRGEETPAFLLFLYLTLMMASYIIIKSASKGLYLSQYSYKSLPWIYIGIALLVGLVVAVYVRLASRVSQATLIGGTLLFFVACVLSIWWGLRVRWSPVAVIYILWTGVFGIIVAVQVWTVANQVLDLRQAKRLFPLISSGGILGSASGGLLGAALVKRVGTDSLLLLLIPALLLSVVIVQVLMRRHRLSGRGRERAKVPEEKKKGIKSTFRTIRADRYLKLIVGLVSVSAIVGIIVGWQFDGVVQQSLETKDRITGFQAIFQGLLSLFSFLLQISFGSRVVERWGVRATILMLPLALLGGTGVLLLCPQQLWAAGVLRGSDGALRYSLDKASFELLYVPVEQSIRAEVKAVTDIVVNRFADGVGGIFLLILTKGFKLGLSGVGFVNLVLIAVWLWLVIQTRKEYVLVLLRNLGNRLELSKSTISMLLGQQASLPTLRTMLSSPDEEIVMYAITITQAAGRPETLPASLATHPSPRVRLKALEVLPMTEQQILNRVREDTDPQVRASAIIRAIKVAKPPEPMAALTQFLTATDLKVRLSALRSLVRQTQQGESQTVKEFLDHIAAELDVAAKEWKDVAEALGDVTQPVAVGLHLRLLQHPDPAVKKQAILSAGRAGHRELVPFLIPLLADRQWAADTRLALCDYGPRILGTLADILRDPAENIEVRRNVPLVLAYFPQQEAVDLLIDGLFDFDGLLRYRAIRSLGKLRLIDPELRFDPQKLSLRIQEECEMTLWYQQARKSLFPQGDQTDLLARLLTEKFERGRERVFRLLALLLPASAAVASFQAMLEDDRLRIATATELFNNVLPRGLWEHVRPLIEPEAGIGRAKVGVRTILEACLKNPDQILRECAAHAIGKGRWPGFAPAV